MTTDQQELFRMIPKVDRVLESPAVAAVSNTHPRSLLLRAVHQVLDDLRVEIRRGKVTGVSDLSLDSVSHRVAEQLKIMARPSLRPVINATGVVVHTNLGRSILPESALRRFRPLAGGYSNLEFDLDRGVRGSRYTHVEGLLKELTGAEGAMVVNNNAAAVLISLQTLAEGREVIVSRGQLVEIGGSFRIPDVMRKSGATMVEVGTTNKTHLRDYEEAITDRTGLLLKVHRSNFQIVGFTTEPGPAELAELGRKHGLPAMEDLGSGSLVDFGTYGLMKEPTVQESLAQGLDLVTFSGDKLLGGPQAGIILGRKEIVDAVRKNQLNRALRIDKLTLLALEETLRLYRDEKAAVKEIPTLKMIFQPYDALVKKADKLIKLIGETKDRNFTIEPCDGVSKVGGGALPLLELPSRLVCLTPRALSAQVMEEWLRSYDPPVISRVERERVLLDVRTIQEREMRTVAQAVNELSQTAEG